ncbi:MAG: zinc ribbon domain-containing protein, partial [Nannocystaceae bacterium]|nr:zinc ribbon domain-containing protein [Nannocystaceae bacterium]
LQATASAYAEKHVPGSRVRNLEVAVVPRQLRTARLGFPAYVLAYRYRDQVFRAIVHGQNPNFVHGQAPLSWLRILVVVGGAIAAIGLVGLIVALVSGR